MRRESTVPTKNSRKVGALVVAVSSLAIAVGSIGSHDSSRARSRHLITGKLPESDVQFLRKHFPGYVLPLDRYRHRESLSNAIESNDEAEVQRLLEAGAEARWGGAWFAIQSDIRAPLFHAIRFGNARIVEMLLQRGARPGGPTSNEMGTSRNLFGQTPLYFAVRCGHQQIVELLLKHGALISGLNHSSKTPLIGAVESGDLEMFNFLVRNGAECDFTTSFSPDRVPSEEWGKGKPRAWFDPPFEETSTASLTLPQLAELVGNEQLEAALSKRFRESSQYTPDRLAQLAVAADDAEGLRRLIEEGYDPATYRPRFGQSSTLLDLAAVRNRFRCFELLQRRGIKQTQALEKASVLRLLVVAGTLPELKRRLNAGAKFGSYSSDRGSPLRLAVLARQEAMVEFLLNQPQAEEWLKDEKLLYSCQIYGGVAKSQRPRSICRRLLNAGVAVPHAHIRSASNPFQLAAKNGWIDVYKLLERRASVTDIHTAALLDAVRANQLEMCRYLLAAGAQVSPEDRLVKKVMYHRNPKLLHTLFQAGAERKYPQQVDVSKGYNLDEDYGHPLYNAAMAGDTDYCRKLIWRFPASVVWEPLKYEQYEYDSVTEYHKGNTPLFATAFNDRAETLQNLLKFTSKKDRSGKPIIDINTKNEYGRTALHFAVIYGASNCVQLLISAGADVTIADSAGNTPLHCVAVPHHGIATLQRYDVNKILPMLIAANVRTDSADWMNRKNVARKTLLHLHAEAGHHKACEMLLAHGADPNAVAKYDVTVLESAMSSSHTFYPAPQEERDVRSRICVNLIDAGADLTERPPNRKLSYFGLAYRRGLFVLIEELKRRGIGPDLKNEGGEYLCSAVQHQRLDQLRHWIAAGVDVNARDIEGNTALHKAVAVQDIEACELLLGNGADPNQFGQDGNPVLFFVFRRFHNYTGSFHSTASEDSAAAIIKMLLKAGANPLLTRPDEAETVFDIYDAMPNRLRQLIDTESGSSPLPPTSAND